MSIDRNIVIKLHKSGESNSELHNCLEDHQKVSGDWKYPRLGRPRLKTDCSYPSTDKKHQGEAVTQLSPKLQELGCCSWCRQIHHAPTFEGRFRS